MRPALGQNLAILLIRYKIPLRRFYSDQIEPLARVQVLYSVLLYCMCFRFKPDLMSGFFTKSSNY